MKLDVMPAPHRRQETPAARACLSMAAKNGSHDSVESPQSTDLDYGTNLFLFFFPGTVLIPSLLIPHTHTNTHKLNVDVECDCVFVAVIRKHHNLLSFVSFFRYTVCK